MDPYGAGRRGILVIGEAPGEVEDRKGYQWQGRTGRLLQRTLHKLGIDLWQDCICINAVNCRPPDNRSPTKLEVACCREVMLKGLIEEYQPKVILLLGAVAVQSFLEPRWPTDLGGITKWRGWVIPDQEYNAWVIPTFHPSYVARIESREANTVWEQDLKEVARSVGVDVPRYFEPKLHFIEDLSILDQYQNAEKMAFDYETNRLNPRKKGSRIISASCAFDDQEAYSFLMPKTVAGRRPFINLLKNPDIKKMAHNFKFEHNWTLHCYGVEVQNWYWDSMLAAHQLDNRAAVTGLKFQTYVNFGVIYGDEVIQYLRKDEKSEEGFNRIYDLLEEPGGPEKLLKYGGQDSHYEFRLANSQLVQLDYELPF